jgi:hypothetical protein
MARPALMINFLMSLLAGCFHRKTTFPLTPIHDILASPISSAVGSRTYVVCLDCGKEFPYNWREMRIEIREIRRAKMGAGRAAEALQLAARH